jgi:hypothetical protein
MGQVVIDEHLVRRYLLGELTEEEREGVEVRLLTDDVFYETFTALEDEVEDELIDLYVDGELDEPGRANFTHVLLNAPERAEKLRLVRDLNERAARLVATRADIDGDEMTEHVVGPAPWQRRFAAFNVFQNPLVGLSCAAALLVAVLLSAWLVIKSNRLEAELKQLQAREQINPSQDPNLKEQFEQLRARNEEMTDSLRRSEERRTGLEQEIASLKVREGRNTETAERTNPPAPRAVVAAITLSTTLRGGPGEDKTKVLNLGRGATKAHLTLNVEGIDPRDYKSFQAVIETAGGAEVWRARGVSVRARGGKVYAVLDVPAERLPEGRYTVQLNGMSADGVAVPISLYSLPVAGK